MYVCHNLRLVYLAVPRTASRSIAQYLTERHNAVPEGKNHMPGGHHGINVPVLEQCQADGYRVVSVVRNPWDYMVSWWHHGQHWLKTNGWSEYLRVWPVSEKNRYHLNGRPFLRWTQVSTDIIRYEELLPGLEEILGEVVQLPRKGISDDRKPYHTYYNEEDRQFIADWYAPEIEEYGYRFEGEVDQ